MLLPFAPPPMIPSAEPVIEHAITQSAAAPILQASVPPARPGHIAEREELDAAIAKGTIEALELFIRRHPRSRYREEAEQRLRALGGQPSRP